MSAEVWVGVIEWGSDRDDWEPAVAVGESAVAVRSWAARRIHDAWSSFPHEWDVDAETLPALDPNDSASVDAWLKEWKEQTTEAWLTVEGQELVTEPPGTCGHGGLIDVDGTVSCERCDWCPVCARVTEYRGERCATCLRQWGESPREIGATS